MPHPKKKLATVEPDLLFLRSLIKKKLQIKGWTYKKLASRLQTSEVSVKRWLTKSDISLQRLIQISKLLDFSLTSLVQDSEGGGELFQYYTNAQEDLFMSDPAAFYIFIRLAFGSSIDQIIAATSLSEHQIRKYLKDFDRVGLVELWPGDKIRLKIKGPYRLKGGAALAKKAGRQLIEAVTSHFINSYDNRVELGKFPNCTVFRATEIYLSQESAYKMSEELVGVFFKYARISGYEVSRKLQLKPISILIGVDNFDAWAQFSLKK